MTNPKTNSPREEELARELNDHVARRDESRAAIANSPTPCRVNPKHPMCCDEHGGAFLNSKGEPTNRCAHASQSARIAELEAALAEACDHASAANRPMAERHRALLAKMEGR